MAVNQPTAPLSPVKQPVNVFAWLGGYAALWVLVSLLDDTDWGPPFAVGLCGVIVASLALAQWQAFADNLGALI